MLGFKNGVGVIAAIAASVLASNIITPICRNIVANKCQDSCKKQEKKPVYNNMPINSVFNAQLTLNQQYSVLLEHSYLYTTVFIIFCIKASCSLFAVNKSSFIASILFLSDCDILT